jgi:flagellar basal-body rod modification protein FlgD
MSVDTITPSTTTSQTTASTTDRSKLGKNDFLALLVKQMQVQDPLNPMDDKEFVAQLAQFSSLEQLTNINTGIDKLNAATTQQQMFSAVGFIGKQVKASGNTLAKTDDTVSSLYYTLGSAATKVSINIMDSNGNIVRTVDQGAKAAGEQTFQWDGKDSEGKAVANGLYTVGVTTQTASGGSTLVKTAVTGIVSSISNNNGTYQLTTQDGRSLSFSDVLGVVDVKS